MQIIRKIQRTKKNQWTLTVPLTLVALLDAKPGDPFSFSLPSNDTILIKKAKKREKEKKIEK